MNGLIQLFKVATDHCQEAVESVDFLFAENTKRVLDNSCRVFHECFFVGRLLVQLWGQFLEHLNCFVADNILRLQGVSFAFDSGLDGQDAVEETVD